MNMNQLKVSVLIFVFSCLNFPSVGFSGESFVEKAEVKKNETLDSIKKVGRSAKDAGCKMLNGKLECAVKKMQSKVNNASDSVETKLKEEKNKND